VESGREKVGDKERKGLGVGRLALPGAIIAPGEPRAQITKGGLTAKGTKQRACEKTLLAQSEGGWGGKRREKRWEKGNEKERTGKWMDVGGR
jgi:hypothetical protein